MTAGEISDRLDADAGVQGGKGRIGLKIGLFYLLAVLLILPLEVLNHHAQGFALQVLVTGVMWCPALAAVMTIGGTGTSSTLTRLSPSPASIVRTATLGSWIMLMVSSLLPVEIGRASCRERVYVLV